jgi:hypothetical protein
MMNPEKQQAEERISSELIQDFRLDFSLFLYLDGCSMPAISLGAGARTVVNNGAHHGWLSRSTNLLTVPFDAARHGTPCHGEVGDTTAAAGGGINRLLRAGI